MKHQNFSTSIIAFCASLFLVGSVNAQDTVKVIEKTTVHDTVQKPSPIQHDTVKVPEKNDEDQYFYHGEAGLRFLPTFTSLTLNNSSGGTVEGTATLTYGYGIMLGLNFSKNIGLEAELNYEAISQKYKDQGLEREVHINYLNIPVLLSINTNKTAIVNLNVVAGPQFGINVGSSVSGNSAGDTASVHAVVAVKEGDVGFAYGAGLDIALNPPRSMHLNFGFRGVYGLVNIDGEAKDANTYNVLVHASRRAYGGYIGLTFSF